MTYFEVSKTIELHKDEKLSIENKEALFFYHSYTRNEFELILEGHTILCGYPENCNYTETSVCRTIENLQNQFVKDSFDIDSKVRLNCPFTGKIEWLEQSYLPEIYYDLQEHINDYITDLYGLDDYHCGFYEGEWGLWPSDIYV